MAKANTVEVFVFDPTNAFATVRTFQFTDDLNPAFNVERSICFDGRKYLYFGSSATGGRTPEIVQVDYSTGTFIRSASSAGANRSLLGLAWNGRGFWALASIPPAFGDYPTTYIELLDTNGRLLRQKQLSSDASREDIAFDGHFLYVGTNYEEGASGLGFESYEQYETTGLNLVRSVTAVSSSLNQNRAHGVATDRKDIWHLNDMSVNTSRIFKKRDKANFTQLRSLNIGSRQSGDQNSITTDGSRILMFRVV